MIYNNQQSFNFSLLESASLVPIYCYLRVVVQLNAIEYLLGGKNSVTVVGIKNNQF